jgi:hypothetical protein
MLSIDGEDFDEFKEWCIKSFNKKFTIHMTLDFFKKIFRQFYNLNRLLLDLNKYDIYIIYSFFSRVKESSISLYILTHIKNKHKEILKEFK